VLISNNHRPRFVAFKFRERWYIEDTLARPRFFAGLGQDHKPSDAASLTQAEAQAVAAALNTLHGR